MSLNSFELESFPPFADQKVKFGAGENAQIHVFTGPNGVGKTRLLQMLALAAGGTSQLQPWVFGGSITGAYPSPHSSQLFGVRSNVAKMKDQSSTLVLILAANDAAEIFTYQCGSRLRETKVSVLNPSAVPESNERLCFDGPLKTDICQHVANIKVQAAMEHLNESVGPKTDRFLKVSNALEEAISDLSGRAFKVSMMSHPRAELKFIWGGQILPISGLPAGLSSVLNWILEILIIMEASHPDSETPLAERALVFLDEPETHLHPAWQRKILKVAQNLFPNATFVIATHSPFIVSSVNEGWIYKLSVDPESEKVKISAPEPASAGDSYIMATKTILGISEWYDVESEEKLETFRSFRAKALAGDAEALKEALKLADEISARSQELANLMGLEIRQLKTTVEAR